MRVTYSPRAVAQLHAVFSYVSKDSPAAAAALVDRIEASISVLSARPKAGRQTNRKGVYLLVVERSYRPITYTRCSRPTGKCGYFVFGTVAGDRWDGSARIN